MSQRRSFLRLSILAPLWARFAFAQAPQPKSDPATFQITGDIPTPMTFGAEDMAKLPRQPVSVPEQDGTIVEYEGVPLAELLSRAGAPLGGKLRGKALASYVLAKANDGYEVVFAFGELDAAFANEKILVADKREEKALFGYQGPFRLVCPDDKAGARSVRMLQSLEVVRLQK